MNIQRNNDKNIAGMKVKAYASYSNNEYDVITSSSGGVFSIFCKYVLSYNGIVYGVTMSEDCKSAHYIRITRLDELIKIKGSKYLQAEINDSFKLVKQDLMNNKLVLFSGTPCSINGLKLFLNNEYLNLICIDIICHGVPSQKLWEKYVNYLEKKHHSRLISVSFRFKKRGWKNFGICKEFEGKKFKYSSRYDDPYMEMFLHDMCLRPSCYSCKAKTFRLSDITIGDLWGVDEFIPEMFNCKGTSVIIVRTEKGVNIFEKICNQIKKKEIQYSELVARNEAEVKSVERPIQSQPFFDDMNCLDFEKLCDKYLYSSKKGKIKKILIKIGVWKLIRKTGVLGR